MHAFSAQPTGREGAPTALRQAASDSAPASDSARGAPKARRRGAPKALRHWPRAPKARVRGGVQGATNARSEKCTVRGKHEIYGDERSKLTNNKSKGAKAQLQGGWQSRAAG